MTKEGNRFQVAPDNLKGYTGLDSEESENEKLQKSQFYGDERKLDNSRTNDIEEEISDYKRKIFKKSDWIKIMKSNDPENVPSTKLYASLRYGIPFDL